MHRPPAPRRKIPLAAWPVLAARRLAGERVVDLAREFDVHPETVRVGLRRRGIGSADVRRARKATSSATRKVPLAAWPGIVAEILGGAVLSRIAGRFGVDAEYLRRRCRKLGVPPRRAGRPTGTPGKRGPRTDLLGKTGRKPLGHDLAPDRLEDFVRRYAAGEGSLAGLAAACGLSPRLARRLLVANAVPIRRAYRSRGSPTVAGTVVCWECLRRKPHTDGFFKQMRAPFGLSRQCSDCINAKERAKHAAFLRNEPQRHARRRARCMRQGLLHRAAKRGHAVDSGLFTVDYIERWMRVQPQCAVPACRRVLATTLRPNGPHYDSPTLDRVDVSGEYTALNTALVCWRCNTVKGDATASDLAAIRTWLLQA